MRDHSGISQQKVCDPHFSLYVCRTARALPTRQKITKNLPIRLTFKWNNGSSKVRNNSKKLQILPRKFLKLKLRFLRKGLKRLF